MIHHIGVSVRDLERSIAFYCTHFGFRVRQRGEFEGAPLAFLKAGGGAELELVADAPTGDGSTPVAADALAAAASVNHFALETADLDGLLARLAEAGVPLLLGPVAVTGGLHAAYVAGPDGEEIELISRSSKSRSAAG